VTGFLSPKAESTFSVIFAILGSVALPIGTDRDGNGGMTVADSTKPIAQHFKRHRFPAEIIGHCLIPDFDSAMGQILQGGAPTTASVRRAINHSQENWRALSKRYEIDQETVAKCKKRASIADLSTGPKGPKSTVLSTEREAIIIASAGIRCCRSTTVSMVCRRRSLTLHDPLVGRVVGPPSGRSLSARSAQGMRLVEHAKRSLCEGTILQAF